MRNAIGHDGAYERSADRTDQDIGGGADRSADAGLRDEHRGKDRPIPLRQCEYLRQRIGKKPGHSHVDAPPEHCCIGGGPTVKVTPQLHAPALT